MTNPSARAAKRRSTVNSGQHGIERRTLLKGAAAGLAAGLLPGCSTRTGSSGEDVYDVVIIGAGLAGLTAARELERAGAGNFLVLEARERVGGRTLNADLGNGYITEIGGQWIGRSQTAIARLAEELGVETFSSWFEGEVAAIQGGELSFLPREMFRPDEELATTIDSLSSAVSLEAPWDSKQAAELDAISLRDWLAEIGLRDDELTLLSKTLRLTLGANPDQVSALWSLFYFHSAGSYAQLEDTFGGAQHLRLVGGSQILSIRMAEELGERLVLGSPVSSIRRWSTEGPCAIETARQTVLAKRVIVALSPSQAHQIEFDPALPEERAALQREWPARNDAIKSMVVYETPFWRELGRCGQSFMLDDGVYDWSFDNSPPDGGLGVLGCFVAVSAVELAPEERKTRILEQYVRCFGERANQPIRYLEQRWAEETYTRGCVSPLRPGVLTAWGSSLRPGLGLLDWAGTETALIWNGYMEGAVRSGQAAARRALDAIG